MVVFHNARVVYYDNGNPVYYKEGNCDSEDTKPVGDDAKDISEGSSLVESDTGDVCFYNQKTDSWVKQFSLQG